MARRAALRSVTLAACTSFVALWAAQAAARDTAPRPNDGTEAATSGKGEQTEAVPQARHAEDVPSEASALFEAGRELAAAGRDAEACEKFESARAIFPGIGIRFHLAECLRRIGRTASAQALFLEVEAATRALGQTERAVVAHERAVEVAGSLSYLLVDIPEPANGLTVEHDLEPVEQSRWGTPFPVDPGEHRVVAQAPGYQSWSATVMVAAEPGVVTVKVPALKPNPKPAVAAKPASKKEPKPDVAEPAAVAEPESDQGVSSGRRTAVLVLGSVGVGALLTGGTFAVLYKASNDDAKAVCPSSSGCTGVEMDTHEQLVDDARRARTWSFVGFGVGAAALGAAAYFFFTGQPEAETGVAEWRAVPFLGGDGFGAAVDGVW